MGYRTATLNTYQFGNERSKVLRDTRGWLDGVLPYHFRSLRFGRATLCGAMRGPQPGPTDPGYNSQSRKSFGSGLNQPRRSSMRKRDACKACRLSNNLSANSSVQPVSMKRKYRFSSSP